MLFAEGRHCVEEPEANNNPPQPTTGDHNELNRFGGWVAVACRHERQMLRRFTPEVCRVLASRVRQTPGS